MDVHEDGRHVSDDERTVSTPCPRYYDLEDCIQLLDAMPSELTPSTIDALASYSTLRDDGHEPEEALTVIEVELEPYISPGDGTAYSYACVRAGLREFSAVCDRRGREKDQ